VASLIKIKSLWKTSIDHNFKVRSLGWMVSWMVNRAGITHLHVKYSWIDKIRNPSQRKIIGGVAAKLSSQKFHKISLFACIDVCLGAEEKSWLSLKKLLTKYWIWSNPGQQHSIDLFRPYWGSSSELDLINPSQQRIEI